MSDKTQFIEDVKLSVCSYKYVFVGVASVTPFSYILTKGGMLWVG